ncbi:biotin synthase BioB [Candidatus Omnitrophota bacterium]
MEDTTIQDNIYALLEIPLTELIARANDVRKEYIGDDFELCSIVNAKSGLCSEDCKFCAQSSRHKAKIETYLLISKEEIVTAAKKAKDVGARKFGIVTSGNRLTDKELNTLVEAISEIKERIDITCCGSLGALNKDQLKRLKEAGLERYHHNIETSPNFYPNIVSTHSFNERIDTIKAAKEAGMQVCSGGIIGLGESWQDRIDMACILRDLDVDSVPLNLLIPLEGTPLENQKTISCNDAIKTIALFRIILKDKIIKIAAGRESILKDFQAMGFMAGANGMLIGGYLTQRGRDIESDKRLVDEVKHLWRE